MLCEYSAVMQFVMEIDDFHLRGPRSEASPADGIPFAFLQLLIEKRKSSPIFPQLMRSAVGTESIEMLFSWRCWAVIFKDTSKNYYLL